MAVKEARYRREQPRAVGGVDVAAVDQRGRGGEMAPDRLRSQSTSLADLPRWSATR